MGRMKTFGKLLTKFNLEKPGKWHFSTNHATIKTWKLMKTDLENDLEKPGKTWSGTLLGEWGPCSVQSSGEKIELSAT